MPDLDAAGDFLYEVMSPLEDMMLLEAALIQLFIIFLLARVFAEIFIRMGMLGQIGEILAGILLANLMIGDWTLASGLMIEFDPHEPSVYHEIFEVIANLGVIFLLFFVGLETKMSDLRAVGRPSTAVAVLGAIIPFILGFMVIYVYEVHIVPHPDWFDHALFMSAAMVATCIGITARVLTELNVMETIESKIIIGAAVVDDIIAMMILAVVVAVAGAGAANGGLDIAELALTIALAVGFVLFILFFCAYCLPLLRYKHRCRLTEKGIVCDEREWSLRIEPFPLAIITCLGLSAVALTLGLAAIIGAFLAGMLFAEYAQKELVPKIKALNGFLVPFFFVYVGMRVELDGFAPLIPLTIVVIFLAIFGKYIAGIIGVMGTDRSLGFRSGEIVGAGMSPRGEVGIIIAAIGLTAGAISREMYSIVVFMSIFTAMIAPPWLARSFKRKYTQDVTEALDKR